MASLAPALLLSMPQLVDPNFNRTVVLLCRHGEEDGAFGLVVNRPTMTSGRVVVNLNPPVTTERAVEVWIGGPVEPQRSWMLLANEDREPAAEDHRIAEGVYLSTSPHVLRRLIDPSPPPRARIVVGYWGWGPGQLEAELEASAWLISEVNADLIFNTPASRMWEEAIRRLGADPSALQMGGGVH